VPDLAFHPSVKIVYSVSVAAGNGSTIVTVAANTFNTAVTDADSIYWAGAVPVTVGSTGQRSFATDSRGTIFFLNTGVALANPIPTGATFLQ
jgi:hypothetical protein